MKAAHYLAKLGQHPVALAFVLCALYLAFAQSSFLFSGDMWAESYAEFIPKAVDKPAWAIIAPSWEGYLTVLPLFFTKFFYLSLVPLGGIDYFFRAVTVAFAVCCVAFLAAPMHRSIIRQDWLRIALGLAVLMLLSHLSSFSFINIWYIGFLPIMFLGLNQAPLSASRQILYTLYGVAVAFTKPSIILAPFLVYRAFKTKEYVSNGIILAATLVQTYLLFFANQGGARSVALSIGDIIQALYVGGGLSLLKIFSIYPHNAWYLLAANLLLWTCLVVVWRTKGLWIALLVAFAYAFSIYSNLLAPGWQPTFDYQFLYNDTFKLQRAFVTNMVVVTMLFIVIGQASKRAAKLIIVVLVGAVLAKLYQPIDATSSKAYASAGPFRQSLTDGKPVCMPVAPNPNWAPGTNWYLQFHGGCTYTNFDKQLNIGATSLDLAKPLALHIDGTTDRDLKTVMVVVKMANQQQQGMLSLRDLATGQVFHSAVRPSPDHLRFVAFDLGSLKAVTGYDFELTARGPSMQAVSFVGESGPAFYTYTIGNQ
jgi:hypothetical protein